MAEEMAEVSTGESPTPSGYVTPTELPQALLLANKIFAGDSGLAMLWFDQRVLDRYRGRSGFRVMRTNTAGRVRQQQGWSLDYGIAPDERLIHLAASDLIHRLPPAERQHWARHLVLLPTSGNFLTMRLGAGSCFDDGDLRDW
jgi:hypothetical protein